MKHIRTFESFLNEAETNFITDSGTLRTKIGNLKYKVNGGLARGGNLGNYQISEDALSKLIDSIDVNSISKILKDNGIEIATRPSEFELNLSNTGLGHNGLSAIIPEILFPVKLSADYPKKQNGWVITKEEYAIYKNIMDETDKFTRGKGYRIHLRNENSSYGNTISDKDSKLTITFEQGSLE
jgi:hypothetical protein